ncbi:hypothetical protein [Deinococcus hopiensis]|uniref:Uncharacterized protein n=1 Tax=Deinococcus hopiensis KR-140 TaxID=695939 RepID=A0A1W1UBM5_9DEIO|nr:hypothetical protein [Deinococcus hopiensis]SMB78201.1 hypothetical protein SAMN00790413_06545 [Deinococcus hopiensis KR-140]
MVLFPPGLQPLERAGLAVRLNQEPLQDQLLVLGLLPEAFNALCTLGYSPNGLNDRVLLGECTLGIARGEVHAPTWTADVSLLPMESEPSIPGAEEDWQWLSLTRIRAQGEALPPMLEALRIPVSGWKLMWAISQLQTSARIQMTSQIPQRLGYAAAAASSVRRANTGLRLGNRKPS